MMGGGKLFMFMNSSVLKEVAHNEENVKKNS